MRPKLISFLAIILGLTACGSPSVGATLTTPEIVNITPATVTHIAQPTDTPTGFPSRTPAPTATATPIPTYTVVIGEVTAENLACRYGPGWPYLYFTGLRKGNRLEVIGRLEDANWIFVQAIGGNKPCWIKAEFMDVQGDVMSVEPVYPEKAKLPVSPYYPPTTILSAKREGNSVTVSWLDIPLRAGDEEDERMNHYIIEVWRCEGGQIRFEPLATNRLEVSFVDEPGCTEPSRGRVFVQEKHGFAGPAAIPWPPYEDLP